jgi:hypothetical protein
VNFGLQIGVDAVNEAMLQMQEDPEGGEADPVGEGVAPTPFAPAVAQRSDENFEDDAGDTDAVSDDEAEETADDGPQTAEVIALDAFRKK